MSILTVEIDSQLCEYLERMHYSVNSELNVIKYMIDSNTSGDLENNKSWQYFYNMYQNDSIEYEMVKNKMSQYLRELVQEQYPEYAEKEFSWEIKDFRLCLVNLKF